MLKKLIKYDMKALNRYLIMIHLFLLVITLLERLLLGFNMSQGADQLGSSIPILLSFIAYFLIIMAVSLATYIIIAIRFYRNLFSDEGYLTNTLPVTHSQHLLAKTVSGSIWSMIDVLVIILCAWFVFSSVPVFSGLEAPGEQFFQMLGFTGAAQFRGLLLYLLFYSLVGACSSTIMVYASIAIGQLFGSHRALGALVAYFSLTTIISVLSAALFSLTGMLGFITPNGNPAADLNLNLYSYIKHTIDISLILCIAVTGILYLLSRWIMTKKINLA